MRTLAKYLLVSSLLIPALSWAHESGEESEEMVSKKGANLQLLPKPKPNFSKTTRPSMVTLQSPEALSFVQGGSTTLKWSESTGADSYQVQVATDPNFKWLLKNEFFFKGTSMELSGLEAGKQYFWRVAGMKADNDPEYLKGFFVSSSFEVK